MSESSFSDLIKNSGPSEPVSDEQAGEDVEAQHKAEVENSGADNSGPGLTSAPAIINTAYVEREDKDEDEFDLERDGAGDGERREVTMGFNTVAHMDPARQRDPHGVYLDDQRRRDAETVRAQVEGREPDYDNPPYTAGDYVVATHVAEQHAQPGTVVTAEKELPVIVGDHYPENDESEEDE